MSFDVVVVGGGAAGCAAAAAAARVGARTLLLEAGPQLGGTAEHAVLTVVCGAFRQRDDAPVWVSDGVVRHLGQQLQRDGGPPRRLDPVWVQPFSRQGWLAALGDLVDTDGLTVHTGRALTVEGAAALSPGAWVDCSGDGATLEALGVDFTLAVPPKRQLPAVSAVVGPVDEGPLLSVRAGIALSRAGLGDVQVHRARGGALLKLSLRPGPHWDPRSHADRDALLAEGLGVLARALGILRAEVSAFAGADWTQRPARLGVRESGRLVGQARLEAADVLEGRRHPDAVAVGSWPIELWQAPGEQVLRPAGAEVYDVPLGALRARDRDHVFAAGRCLSASHEALASIRVLGGCLETGQAAGTAAALRALRGRVDAADVQPYRDW